MPEAQSDTVEAAVAETKTALEAWTEAGHQMIADAMARAKAAVPTSMAPLAAATETALKQLFSHMVQGPEAWLADKTAHTDNLVAQAEAARAAALPPRAFAGSTPPVSSAIVFPLTAPGA